MSETIRIVVMPPGPIRLIKMGTTLVTQTIVLPSYTKVLSGYSVAVLQSEHGIASVHGLMVQKPDGKVVEVAEQIVSNNIQINSNILLDAHTLTIY